MASLHSPIPALYTVYVLRSTIRHASFYVGSTPNPPRRLSQHNGLVGGGAVRTSRGNLRPWEMITLVSGFPSSTAALKFEWALNNPHLSVHIPSALRSSVVTRTKRKRGKPRRPAKSMASVASCLHLLLRVPSFARWPLRVHFFNRDAFRAWEKWCSTTAVGEGLMAGLKVVTDFGGERRAGDGEEGEQSPSPPPWGIHALPLDYEPVKEYVAKGQEIFEFERQGRCLVCREEMKAGEGLHALCTHDGCDGVGHVSCWGRHFLKNDEAGSIVPVQGHCPKCKKAVDWGDMMKELTLRVRGHKEVKKLLKRKPKRVTKETNKA
ncbi:structure-specific endonuclease subunit SLX1 [Chaetomium fimeti]|uniref:Structure-specific endonuclease subunit SLX1 n=1 Tax=Chaetomium fimeti TaxID=1854472 RepID=A0AAE0HIW6_9PEZI|nr:structure-specific endonuclease subunit SLX1 [Chaetomium fimeti]